MDCSLPDSSIHGIFQARILRWVAISGGLSTRKVFASVAPVSHYYITIMDVITLYLFILIVFVLLLL